jgi:hypothetical protein
MKRLFLLPALAMFAIPSVIDAACVAVPRTGAKLYDECKLRTTLTAPNTETRITSFPRGSNNPTFDLRLEWIAARVDCDPNQGEIYPFCSELDTCLVTVTVDPGQAAEPLQRRHRPGRR